jgi:hypothetical protein
MAGGAKRDQQWAEAQRRYRLSQGHVRMGRELGLNPSKLGRLANHWQELWKAPLTDFIEHIYQKRFKRDRPLAPRQQRAQPETERGGDRAARAG